MACTSVGSSCTGRLRPSEACELWCIAAGWEWVTWCSGELQKSGICKCVHANQSSPLCFAVLSHSTSSEFIFTLLQHLFHSPNIHLPAAHLLGSALFFLPARKQLWGFHNVTLRSAQTLRLQTLQSVTRLVFLYISACTNDNIRVSLWRSMTSNTSMISSQRLD